LQTITTSLYHATNQSTRLNSGQPAPQPCRNILYTTQPHYTQQQTSTKHPYKLNGGKKG
jgi:hypothetical protein